MSGGDARCRCQPGRGLCPVVPVISSSVPWRTDASYTTRRVRGPSSIGAGLLRCCQCGGSLAGDPRPLAPLADAEDEPAVPLLQFRRPQRARARSARNCSLSRRSPRATETRDMKRGPAIGRAPHDAVSRAKLDQTLGLEPLDRRLVRRDRPRHVLVVVHAETIRLVPEGSTPPSCIAARHLS